MQENKARIKSENYLVIQGWMVNDLKLKGNELLVYAIIYGFSQEDGQKFTGSLQYLANWTNASKETIRQCLKSLVDKGLLYKEEEFISNVKFCRYYTRNLVGVYKNLGGGIQETCTNNTNYNTSNNNKYNIYEQEFEKLWSLYPNKKGKSNALKSYIKSRKKGISYEDIYKGIINYLDYIKIHNTKEQYIKHGSTWFNQECWNDTYSTNKDVPNWFSKEIKDEELSEEERIKYIQEFN